MGRTLTIVSYKLRFFFGPALRGRAGPLLYAALILLFVPSGWFAGAAFGTLLLESDAKAAVDLLGTPLAAILALALVYSLGAGVTAHVSEFDFFLTASIKPREYLRADLFFQFLSLVLVGGLSVGVAATSLVITAGRPIETVVPLLAILLAYGFLVLMVSQVLVVLRVRYPRRPIRLLTGVLLVLALLPSVGVASPDFPLRFNEIPMPSTGFARVAYAVFLGAPLAIADIIIVVAYLGFVGSAWFVASDVYIFHGIRPTLSAGFGQVDMASRMETQRRLIGGLGGVTTRIHLRPERGGETSLMTRLHLIRIWRDGSIIFVILFAAIAMMPILVAGGDIDAPASLSVTQILLFLLAILAINWSYYERENLWLVLTAPGRMGTYFRGLLLGLATIGLAVSLVFLGALSVAAAVRLSLYEVGLPVAAPIAAAMTAAALLTRVKLKPAAFSPAIFGILILVVLGGLLGGLAAQGLLVAGESLGRFGGILQGALLLGYVAGLSAFGLWSVTRLAAGFRL